MKILKKVNIIFTIFILIIFILCNNIYAEVDNEEVNYNELVYDENDLEVSTTPIKEPVISSRAAIVIDRKTGLVLYEKNSNDVRKMASTTKIMTATVVLENVQDLSQVVTVSKKAASVGGSTLGLKTNDKITIHDLLYGLMLKSGNDTAIALAEAVGGSVEGFAELMNKKAEELGLQNTHYVTPHGLDSEEHYTTAYELAKLTNYALNNDEFLKIVSTKNYTVTVSGRSIIVSNGNELLGYFSGVYGVKTGFTNGANRCLVTACKRGDIDVISVVLGADTKTIRTKDSMNILNYVFKNFKYMDLESKIKNEFFEWEKDNFVEVIKGQNSYVSLKMGNITYPQVLLKEGDMNSISINFECTNVLEAPVYENTKIGEIIILNKGEDFFTVDILADKTVDKKNISDNLYEIFSGIKEIMLENQF